MDKIEKKESLICECLVREIIRAKRWSAVEEAWQAILKVRLMGKQLRKELGELFPSAATAGKLGCTECHKDSDLKKSDTAGQ